MQDSEYLKIVLYYKLLKILIIITNTYMNDTNIVDTNSNIGFLFLADFTLK